MEQGSMQKRIAYLEFVNDQLMTEIRDADHLLKQIGFPEGLETVKLAARELMKQEDEEESTQS